MLQLQNAVLTVIDIQQRLAEAMPNEALATTKKNAGILLRAAELLNLPVLVTEQYPRGLGPTIPELRALLPKDSTPTEKVEFSCTGCEPFVERLKATGRKQVIVAGMETHICVLQTVWGLGAMGYDVWVAMDAVCSRQKMHWKAGLRLAEEAGAIVAPTETIVFALLKKAGTPEFKALSALIK